MKGTEELLNETYCPDMANRVAVDLSDIVTSSLTFTMPSANDAYTDQSSIFDVFSVKIDGTVKATFTAVRAGVENFSGTASEFLAANWLTWQPQIKEVLANQPEWLTYYIPVTDGACWVRFYYTDGTVSDYKICDFPFRCFSLNTMFSRLWNLDESGKDRYGVIDVLAKNIQGKVLTYVQRYVLRNKESLDQIYLCENSLGGLDTFRFNGDRKLVPEIEYTPLQFDGIYSAADPDINRKWSQNTGLLTDRESRWCWEIFRSTKVYHLNDGSIMPVVLDSSSIEKSDMARLSSFSFEYRYSEDKGLLRVERTDSLPDIVGIPGPDGEIFFLEPRLVDYPEAVLSDNLLLLTQSPFEEKWYKLSIGSIRASILTSILETYGSMLHTHDNLSVLNMLSVDGSGKLLFNGLPVGGGGEHIDTSDFVTLSTAQTVTGDKTFASDVIPGGQKTDGTRGRLFLPSSLGTGAVDIFVDTETGIDGETPEPGAGGNAAWEVSTHRAHAVLNVSGERKEVALYGHRHTVSEISGLLGTDGLILSSLLPSVQSPVTSVAGLTGDITVSALRDALTDTDHLFVTSAEKSLWTSKWTWSEEAVKAVKVNNAVNADRLGGVPASDYVRTAALEDFCEGYLMWGALPQDNDSIQVTNGLGQSRSVSLHGHHHAVSDVDTGDGWDALLKAAKPTTLAGYGITNAYTQSEVDTKLTAYLPLAGGTMNDGAEIKFSFYGGQRVLRIHEGLHWDMSNTPGGYANVYAQHIDPAGASYTGMGVYGNIEGLSYIYLGGSYTSPWMVLTPSGNVGIGTTAPAYRLDVNGSIRATSYVYASQLFFENGSARLVFDSSSDATWIQGVSGKPMRLSGMSGTDLPDLYMMADRTRVSGDFVVGGRLYVPSSLGNEVFDIYVDTEVNIDGEVPVSGGGLDVDSLWTELSGATASSNGGIRTGYSGTGKNYPVRLNSTGQAYVSVPWVNTTYSLSSFGITATAAEINKLDGVDTLLHSGNVGSYALTESNYSSTLDGRYMRIGSSGYPTAYRKVFNVNGTAWSFLGTTTDAPTIYAPTTAGTSGYVLQSTAGTPKWVAQNTLVVKGIYEKSLGVTVGDTMSDLKASLLSLMEGSLNKPGSMGYVTTASVKDLMSNWSNDSYALVAGSRTNFLRLDGYGSSTYGVFLVSGYGGSFYRLMGTDSKWSGPYTILDTGNYTATLDSRYLLKSTYTAADVLAKIKTVDGAGSGLDADLLDGTQKSGLLTAVTSTSTTNLSVTVGGTVKSVADLYAASATRLANSRTLWGQSFDGTQNVSGDMSGVGDITMLNDAAIRLTSISNRLATLSGSSLNFDRSALTGGWTAHINVTMGDTVQTIAGAFGGSGTVNYLYYGGTYTSPLMAILPSGNVGIGTTAPAYKLHVIGSGYFSSTLKTASELNANTVRISSTSATAHLAFSRANYNYMTAPSGGGIAFVTNGKEVNGDNTDMYVGDGRVSVGGSLSSEKLCVPSSLGNEVFDIYVDTEVNIDGEVPVSGGGLDVDSLWTELSGSAPAIPVPGKTIP